MTKWLFWIIPAFLAARTARCEEVRPHPCDAPGAGRALCATFPVWENRTAKSGRKLDLHVVILPALQANRLPDPLFVLDGGPGAAATRLAPVFARHPVRARRDIVLIDQRGTGESNRLDCDFYGDPPDLQRLMTSEFPLQQVRECRQRLEKVADLTQYTTSIAVDDFDEARQWLGYEKINLWGGSYGSRAAQEYVRHHESRVRSAVLEGVVPPDEFLPLHHAWAAQRAMNIFFDRCRTDGACRSKYPHLAEDFLRMFERVRVGAEVTVRDTTGRSVRVRPSVLQLAEGIRHRLYGDTGDALAGMIHQAAAGNLAPVVEAAIEAELSLQGLADGLLLSVSCTEDIPYITDAMAARETAGTFLGELRIREQRAACAEWTRGAAPRDIHEMLRTQVPVLLISGYRDPVTPPEFAERVAAKLANKLHVVFPNGAHGGEGACGRNLVTDFVERGSAVGISLSCVGTTR